MNEAATRDTDLRTWILGHLVRSRPHGERPGVRHSAFI
ncbi:hypothetical protein STRTUCAR8_03979 [Streptomyces turgidiscabies Car8]|uniref:Uncharacterized protein n=1 Tax=Streptomyces turgidiscabies (strain Car8) TaxID=698760 RepID=L7FBR9_STRT8|nr:hypothetical protein STRTUCAR8_03979 [Streptomyces turgidiscabies Car8]